MGAVSSSRGVACCPVDSTVIDANGPQVNVQLLALCRRVVGDEWRDIGEGDVEVTQVRGGITNFLYRLAPRTGSPFEGMAAPLLARVFGQVGDVIIDRARENVVVQELHKADFGPRLHGIFGNGRFEAWLEGRRPLEGLELLQAEPVDFQALITRRLAEMHEKCAPSCDFDIWAQVRAWMQLAKQVAFPHDAAKAAKLRRFDPLPRCEEVLALLEGVLPSARNGQGHDLLQAEQGRAARRAKELLFERRFCHLDLLAGNILYSEEAQDVEFIDYEYATRTCIGLDIASHFNSAPESCRHLENTWDVEKYYPSRAMQSRWLKHYFRARGMPLDENDDELLDELSRVVLDFSVLVELRWILWSVVQAAHSPADFDYLEYGTMRLELAFSKYLAWRESGGRP